MFVFSYIVPDKLTTINQILLAVGIVLLCVAVATGVILIGLRIHIKGDTYWVSD